MLCIAEEGSKSVGVLVGKVRENRFRWEPWWDRAPVWCAGGTTALVDIALKWSLVTLLVPW